MASGKGRLLSALGGLVLRQGRVSRARQVSPRFRWLTVSVAGLRQLNWTPGDKIQVLLPELDVRTFTPFNWQRDSETLELLLYRNQPPGVAPADEHPGTRWFRTVCAGDSCRFVGPQRSLEVAAGTPFVLFGDETSFAVALALCDAARPPPACVFEVDSAKESAEVLAECGLRDAVCVERTADDSHLTAAGAQLEKFLSARTDAKLLMSGRAQAIQALQARRRAGGQSRPHKTKAYWSMGKAGLD